MTLTSWTSEPKGPGFLYMARASWKGGRSVYCHTWVEDTVPRSIAAERRTA